MTLKFNEEFAINPQSEGSGGGGTKGKVLNPDVSICGNYCFLQGNCLTQRGTGNSDSGNSMHSGALFNISDYNCNFINNSDVLEIEFTWSLLASAGSNDRGIIRFEGNNAQVTLDLFNGKFRCYNTIAGGSTDIINTNISPTVSNNYKIKTQIYKNRIVFAYKINGDTNYTSIVDKTYSASQLSNLLIIKLLYTSTYQLLSQINFSDLRISFNNNEIEVLKPSLEKTYNFSTNGELVNSNGYLTGFKYSTSINNAYIESPDFSAASNFEIVFKFRHDLSEVGGGNASIFAGSVNGQVISANILDNGKVGFGVGNSTATGWQTTEASTYGTTVTQAQIWYWYKVVFTGTQYIGYLSTDGENYTTEWTFNSTMTPSHRDSDIIMIGTNRAPSFTQGFNGIIDMNECYIKIDGETVWKGVN